MSEAAKKAREAMKSKIARLTRSDSSSKVDASDYSTPDALNAGIKTGLRPLSRRQFKSGGKVEGEAAKQHAGKKPRKSGNKEITADSLVNRNVREANEEREGIKHVGGFKRGGKAHKNSGGILSALSPTAMALENKDKLKYLSPTAMALGAKRGGKISEAKWEHSKKDLEQDQKLSKKHGMSMEKWEKSALDKKHDKQQSLKGLKHGGSCSCKACGGGVGRADGGRTDARANERSALPVAPPPTKPDARRPNRALTPAELAAAGLDMSKPAPPLPERMRKAGGSVSDGKLQGTRPEGGRLARKTGGKTDRRAKWMGEFGAALGEKRPKRIDWDTASHQYNTGVSPSDAAKSHIEEGYESDLAYPSGARVKRKAGGRTKGKTNINIIIGTGPKPAAGPMGLPMPPPGMDGPAGLHQGAMSPGAGGPPPPPMMPPGGAPPMGAGAPPMPPMMGRRSGGRVKYPITHAAGGGLGRLEKIEAYGHKAHSKKS